MNHVITKTDDDKSRLQKVKTSDGFELSFRLVDGIPLPDFPGVVDAVREFKSNFQVREDDVWIVAYPNSGTHWLWEVTSMITRDKAERISEIKEIAMVEIQSKFKWAMNGLPSRRVLNTHVYPTHFNQSALKQNKFIVIVRNPKDVAVSRYNMIRGILRSQYEGNFEGFLDLFIEDKLPFGGWYTHLHAWWTVAQQMKDRFLFITYEDCKKDLTSNVRRITEFIGLKKDDSFYEDVATLCGFQRMKEEKILDETEKQKWKENACGFYRKGSACMVVNEMPVANMREYRDPFLAMSRLYLAKLRPRYVRVGIDRILNSQNSNSKATTQEWLVPGRTGSLSAKTKH